MFKKHAVILAIGAMFSVPSFAQSTAEGVIYQDDQSSAGSQASINQTGAGGATFGVIQQIDTQALGAGGNQAAVIQGAGDGTNQVTIDPSGTFATNNAVTTTGAAVNSLGTSYVINAMTFTDQEGLTPIGYTVQGTTSNNYAAVSQDGQTNAQALVIQASSTEADTQIPLQASLANFVGTSGQTVDIFLNDNGVIGAAGGSPVEVTYTGSTLGIGGLLGTGVTLTNFIDNGAGTVSGNIGVVVQGADLSSLTTPNGVALSDTGPAVDGISDSEQALIIQASTNSYAFIGQNGNNNAAAIIQGPNSGSGAGDSDYAEIVQYVDANQTTNGYNFAFTAQVGSNDLAQTYQGGSYNEAYTFQNGDGHVAAIDQDGAYNIAFVYQSGATGLAAGAGNVASIYQH